MPMIKQPELCCGKVRIFAAADLCKPVKNICCKKEKSVDIWGILGLIISIVSGDANGGVAAVVYA